MVSVRFNYLPGMCSFIVFCERFTNIGFPLSSRQDLVLNDFAKMAAECGDFPEGDFATT